MTKLALLTICCLCSFFFVGFEQLTNKSVQKRQETSQNKELIHHTNGKFKPAVPTIKLALLLDTSSSMDGLIDQAKAQLWTMVNLLAGAKKNGNTSNIQIALYEYGNSGLDVKNGYIKMIVPFNNDLDMVSNELFKLKTNGGSEFCGQVIDDATKNLNWVFNGEKADFQMIIIAGNEAFTQGTVDYKVSCPNAKKQGIIINTIYCGRCEQGILEKWQDGAQLGGGKYMCINTNEKMVYIQTPYDKEIIELNSKLNNTYIPYGSKGREKKEMQIQQDKNAESYGSTNMSTRVASKSKAVYKNDEWDLVDAYKSDNKVIENVKKDELPDELKGKSSNEIKAYVESKKQERESIQQKISSLNQQAESFRATERKKMSETKTLDNVMLKTIQEQAEKEGFIFEN